MYECVSGGGNEFFGLSQFSGLELRLGARHLRFEENDDGTI
jgi:hypothetical protein